MPSGDIELSIGFIFTAEYKLDAIKGGMVLLF